MKKEYTKLSLKILILETKDIITNSLMEKDPFGKTETTFFEEE